ncbi:S-adenosyl-L-methionine-dependent methyltransferase [Gaertneriomyces semiglobifer]|nr:S-adenosyl-L-methionine-dependent methyltransferase [Gaertneriomyces semiglobifer]
MTDVVRALEFFSGIGGLHYGLEFADPTAQVVAAFDINEHADKCYLKNFQIVPVKTGVQSLTVQKLVKYNANCWLMSPPCQPYTQGGKSLDDKDPRAEGLLSLIDLIGKLPEDKVPLWVFVENVPGFEVSNSRTLLVNKLDELGFRISEFLVSPTQLGVSNERRRYYLCASRSGAKLQEGLRYIDHAEIYDSPFSPSLFESDKTPPPAPRPIADYLEQLSEEEEQAYLVPHEFILKRHQFRFDIVKPTDRKCSCFTKAYGSHHLIGSGSMLQTKRFEKQYDFNDPTTLLDLGLRFFTPLEVARFHCFPVTGERELHSHLDNMQNAEIRHQLVFPDDLTIIQKWRLLGNSLNVRVVGTLMRDILFRK